MSETRGMLGIPGLTIPSAGLGAGAQQRAMQQQMNDQRTLMAQIQAQSGITSVERGARPGLKPKRLVDMKGAEAAAHMLASARRRLCPKMRRWGKATELQDVYAATKRSLQRALM